MSSIGFHRRVKGQSQSQVAIIGPELRSQSQAQPKVAIIGPERQSQSQVLTIGPERQSQSQPKMFSVYKVKNDYKEEVKMPPTWRVIRHVEEAGERIKYAIKHDKQTRYDGHDIDMRNKKILVHLSKEKTTKNEDGEVKIKDKEWSWLNKNQEYEKYTIGISVDMAMWGKKWNATLVDAPPVFVGTVIEIQAQPDDNVKVKSKVTWHFFFCCCVACVIFFFFVVVLFTSGGTD